jgi:hypothetical protein
MGMNDWTIYTFPGGSTPETPEVLEEGPLPRGKKEMPLY